MILYVLNNEKIQKFNKEILFTEAQAVPNPDSTHIMHVARWTALACLGMGIVQGIAAGSFFTCCTSMTTFYRVCPR